MSVYGVQFAVIEGLIKNYGMCMKLRVGRAADLVLKLGTSHNPGVMLLDHAVVLGSGADFIFIHGRTPAQRYEGKSSRDAIEEAARLFPGMIGGSGDCYEPEDFLDHLNRGCAAVLAGRGILRDVFMIPKTLRVLGGEIPPQYCEPSLDFQSELLLELGRSIYNTEGQTQALMISRRMLSALFKGFSGAAQLRRRGALARTWQEMEDLLIRWQEVRSMPEIEITAENFPRGIIGG